MGVSFRPRGVLTACLVLGGLSLAVSQANAQLKAVPLPDPHIPGYTFPEVEANILNWITASSNQANGEAARKNIYLHGWGLWTSLTAETDQVVDGEKIRVFETWFGPEDLTPKTTTSLAQAMARPRGRSKLKTLRQHAHLKPGLAKMAGTAATIDRVAGFVKFDPSASDHIMKQGLLSAKTLNSFLANGANAIPPFVNTAVSIKPTFQVLASSALKNGRYYPLPAWPGPPPTPLAFPTTKWNSYAWIDVKDGGMGTGEVDKNAGTSPDGSTRTDATTYPVSKLISYKLSAAEAAAWNASPPGLANADTASAGDYVVLVAMHVTTKEVTRWTWQTFWWTPAPDVAILPTTSEMLAARPAQLTGPARNYAIAFAYATESPAQPYVGGSNVSESVYGFNPWLEARFGPSDLPDSKSGIFNGQPVANNVGVQTNCMSCHGAANYNPNGLRTAPNYSGDRYIDLNDPAFRGVLTVDFLWSVADEAQ